MYTVVDDTYTHTMIVLGYSFHMSHTRTELYHMGRAPESTANRAEPITPDPKVPRYGGGGCLSGGFRKTREIPLQIQGHFCTRLPYVMPGQEIGLPGWISAGFE